MTVSLIDSLQKLSGETQKYRLRYEGFIDEALVRQMVMGNAHGSERTCRKHMAISSSEDDYAGWNLPANASLGRAA
jgi:hypothetical protein